MRTATIITNFLLTGLLFFIISFAELSFNIFNWSVSCRLFFALVFAGAIILGLGAKTAKDKPLSSKTKLDENADGRV